VASLPIHSTSRIRPSLLGWSAAAALLVLGSAAEARGESGGIDLFDMHRTLGTFALGAFASSLVIGSASGNLGKLMDPKLCCPDGGARSSLWRTTDRVLVTAGIVAYTGAAALALYNLVIARPPSDATPRMGHQPHRYLALAHGTVFATSAVTGLIMFLSQSSNPERFARTARIHTASNVVLVPLLTAALSNILFE
jgi:hypothetical protein